MFNKLKNVPTKLLLSLAFILLASIIFLLRLRQKPELVEAGWWNDTWHYRNNITITNNTSQQSNVYTTVSIGTSALIASGKMQSDCGDLRFTNGSGSLLPYYIVSGCNTDSTSINVNHDIFPAGVQLIYYYYGNPSAPNGTESSNFSIQASNYSIGSLGSEEKGTGPIAHWDFNEGAGSTFHDVIGNNHGFLGAGSSAPTWTDGKINKGLSFDGTNSMASISGISDNLKLITDSTFSISAWVRPTTTTSGIYYPIVASQRSTSLFFGLYGNSPRLGLDDGFMASGATLNTNEWTHVIVTYDGGTTQATFYVDGKQYNTATNTDTASSSYTILYIGYESRFPERFEGSIDEVKIFDYALTPDQIKVEYNRGASVAIGTNQKASNPGSTNLVAEWKFEEGTGTTAYDTSGNNNHSTQWNGTPVWTSGKFGKSLLFDGSGNSGIEIISPTNLNSPTFTASVWIDGTNQDSVTRIINFGDSTTNYGGYIIGQNTNGTIRTYIDTSGTAGWDGLNSIGTVNDGKWHHVALVYDGTNRYIYIDGIRDTATDIPSAYFHSPTNPILTIGQGSYNNEEHKGKIDHVKIWNTALTPAQIMYEYNQGEPIAHYKLDEGFGTSANNSGGLGSTLNATLYNSTPWSTNGKFGKALSFNGSSNYYAQTPSSILLDSDQSYTVWFSPASITGLQGIFTTHNHGSNSNFGLNICNTGKVGISIGYTDETREYCNKLSNYTLSQNQWTQATLTYSLANNLVKLYINGILDNQWTLAKTAKFTSARVLMGEWSNNCLPCYRFNGLVDESKVFNYTLTPEEVAIEYNRGAALALGVSQSTIDAGTTNLVAEWKFEEGTGTTAYDTSGNNNNGSLINNPSWSTGKFGKALTYNGSNQRIACGTNISPTNITISTWVYRTASTNNMGIIRKEASYALSLYNNTIQVVGNPWGFSNTGVGIDLNRWTHLAITQDGTNFIVYKDGLQIGNFSQNGNLSSNSNQTYIAYDNNNWWWNGKIDHVKIWNTALTPAQIAWEYNQGAPIGHWRLDECQGTTANDASGNNNHGTVIIDATGDQTSAGTCSSADSSHAWYNGSNGIANSSIKLDGNGTADGVTTGDNIQIPESITRTDNYPGGVTYSIWINVDTNAVNRMSLFWGAGTIRHIEIYSDSKYFRTEAALQNGYSFGSGNFPDNVKGTWSHFVIVFANNEPGRPVRWYQNGKLFHTGSLSGGTYPDTEYFSFSSIGRSTGSTSYSYAQSFDGKIDDFRIYNYPLTDDQVKNLYNGGSAIKFN